jgi:D-alanine-D-alanine ligase
MTHMQPKRTLAILFGGRSGEHEVSLMSARSILSVLDRTRYTVIEVGITHDGTWLTGPDALSAFEQGQTDRLSPTSLLPDPARPRLVITHNFTNNGHETPVLDSIDVDVFFPVLHGTYGEDGTIQGLFELADVAYVGAGVVGSAVGMEKGVFKDVMLANQVPVVKSITVLRSEVDLDIASVVDRAEKLGSYPIFIKPANLGSSVGITKCRSKSDLYEGLLEACRYDRRIIIERGVNQPREIEVSVLGNDTPRVSIPGEIIPGADFYSYEAKYLLNTSELRIPAPLSEAQTTLIQTLAVKAFKAIDCSGMARVDFLLDTITGDIFLNEINTIPGFTKISMFPKLWEASGLSYSALIDCLIELGLERKADRERTSHLFRRDK